MHRLAAAIAFAIGVALPTAPALAQPACVAGSLPASNLLALGGCRLGSLLIAIGGNTGHGRAANVDAIQVSPLLGHAGPTPIGLRFSVLDHPLTASVSSVDAPYASDFLEVSMWVGRATPGAALDGAHLVAPTFTTSGFPAGQAKLDASLVSMPALGNSNYEYYSVLQDGEWSGATHECQTDIGQFERPCTAPYFAFVPDAELRLYVGLQAVWSPSASASGNGFGGPGPGPMSVTVTSVDVMFATDAITTTPEPATFALAAPLVAIGCIVRRRRRRA